MSKCKTTLHLSAVEAKHGPALKGMESKVRLTALLVSRSTEALYRELERGAEITPLIIIGETAGRAAQVKKSFRTTNS